MYRQKLRRRNDVKASSASQVNQLDLSYRTVEKARTQALKLLD
jgi:hypothetical protein